MNKKGFTLVELLGVIILISLITLIVLPNIVDSVRNSSNKVDDVTLNMIYKASDLYISNHEDNFPKEAGYAFIINLSDLVNDNLLSSPITLSTGGDLTNTKCVQVTYNGSENKFNYELKNSGECVKRDKTDFKVESINISYDDCDSESVMTCIPTITILPENAYNKQLSFTLGNVYGDTCTETSDQFSQDVTEYLSIDNTSGIITKLKLHPQRKSKIYGVVVTVNATDGSGVSKSIVVKFTDSDGWSCWLSAG